MALLDTKKLHHGSGRIVYKGGVVGEIKHVDFMMHKLGLSEAGDSTHTCYGTVDGRITKREIIDDLNGPEPAKCELIIALEGGEGEVRIVGVEFVDEIPLDGTLSETEFDGTLAD
jgi:hypothetical protein